MDFILQFLFSFTDIWLGNENVSSAGLASFKQYIINNSLFNNGHLDLINYFNNVLIACNNSGFQGLRGMSSFDLMFILISYAVIVVILFILLFKLFKWIFTLVFKLFRVNR